MYTVFDVLTLIEFESGNTDYQSVINIRNKESIYNSRLFRLWRWIYNRSLNVYLVEKFFTKFFGGHISIGRLTIFGCNAMMFCFRWRTDKGIWSFTPPAFNLFKHRFRLGSLYFSPDGTPHHKNSVKFYYCNY